MILNDIITGAGYYTVPDGYYKKENADGLIKSSDGYLYGVFDDKEADGYIEVVQYRENKPYYIACDEHYSFKTIVRKLKSLEGYDIENCIPLCQPAKV